MSFERHPTNKWLDEVPGVRWFKADLHVHTIDDHPGGRAKMPAGLSGPLTDTNTLAGYARLFLQRLIERGVQVVGLTPHSPRTGDAPETSAVWRIVEEWNSGADDDGIPFREKIYAVFPGFEPSLREGREGLHLLFLFDPEIGRERYLRSFDLVMGAVSPWKGGNHRISNRRANEAFDDLQKFQEQENECFSGAGENRSWHYLVLAPHIDAQKGLLGAQKAQVLQIFDHGAIAGLELGDEKLPKETLHCRSWLCQGMKKHGQAFFHASDAYALDEIGNRHTWIKLASPRIEALRQAFIACDSRMRIGFEKSEDGALQPIGDPPDVTLNERPWLKDLSIQGGASFFGGKDLDGPRETRFRFSPDLTCIIGGSMTGKSALLDGLRIQANAPMPDDEAIHRQVKARGQEVFGAGSPKIALVCPGNDPTAPLDERWPALFFAQNELQRLSQECSAVEDILAKLAPSETEGISERTNELRILDDRLIKGVQVLAKLDGQLADAEQAYERARAAKEELTAFSEAGVEDLHRASREQQLWTESSRTVASIRQSIGAVVESAAAFDVPQMNPALAKELRSRGGNPDLDGRWAQAVNLLRNAECETKAWSNAVAIAVEILVRREAELRVSVERALADRGLNATKLKEVQELNRRASLLSSYQANLERTREQRKKDEELFARLRKRRHEIINQQREAFRRVGEDIEREFGNRIRVRRVDNGDCRPLKRFLEKLHQRGITRWWNGLAADARPSPDELVASIDACALDDVGMSGTVQETFQENITRSKERELAALRCPDTFVLELRMDDGAYRRLDELSGGQRVSVLLSLLLETDDDRPLVIDQPEDELDNRFLSETVLPALKKLRGRRQVIVATHNANVVVNGDADMVIQLEATARQGRVACAGAIEEPAVRGAIVRTVDGGEEAFRLRYKKYGF